MSPDEIRRSWDDDDAPRSVFPEPLAERLTRENKELRAEVAQLEKILDRASRDTLNEAREYRVLAAMHEDTKARLDALVADLRELLADEWRTEPDGRRLYRWPVELREDFRAVLDKHAGEQP